MTLRELLGRLDNVVERQTEYLDSEVQMMIEFEGKGQWQAPVKDVAVTTKQIILIYEDIPLKVLK